MVIATPPKPSIFFAEVSSPAFVRQLFFVNDSCVGGVRVMISISNQSPQPRRIRRHI
jgi:hypothetical protein